MCSSAYAAVSAGGIHTFLQVHLAHQLFVELLKLTNTLLLPFVSGLTGCTNGVGGNRLMKGAVLLDKPEQLFA
jgi:hypothetical protein